MATPEEEKAYLTLLISGKYDLSDDPELDAIWYSEADESAISPDEARLREQVWNELHLIIMQRERQTVMPSWWLTRAGRLAASVAAVVIMAAYWQFLGDGSLIFSENSFLHRAMGSGISFAASTERSFLRLGDGSMVVLNTGSGLYYPEDFDDRREVQLTGEAFFEVVHDPMRPFQVKAKNVVVTVLGTAFAVKARQDQGEVSIKVVEGRVNVSDGAQTLGTLGPGFEMVVNTSNMQYDKRKFDDHAEMFWKDNFVLLRDVPVGEVLQYICKQFPVKIAVANPALNSCRISLGIDLNGDARDLLRSVCVSLNATYVANGNQFTIHGGSCGQSYRLR